MEKLNDLLYFKNLKVYQNSEMFEFSLDSVLLPNFVTINKKCKKILDIGTGNAPIPLILTTRTDAKIIGVELQEKSVELAKKNIELNHLTNQITILHDNIKEYYKKEESDTFDTIICNPPFFKNIESSRKNKFDEKTIARHEVSLNINDIFMISKKLLKNNGNIAIVHRPERLIEILSVMRENNIEPKKIRFVYPFKEKEANVLLIEGTKNGKPGVKILPPLYTHNQDGSYTDDILKIFGKEENN